MVIILSWKIGDTMKKYEVITTNPIKVRKYIKTKEENIEVLTNLKDIIKYIVKITILVTVVIGITKYLSQNQSNIKNQIQRIKFIFFILVCLFQKFICDALLFYNSTALLKHFNKL